MVDGPKYYAKEIKPRKRWVTVGSWVMSGLLILGGLVTPYWFATLFGLLYILALMMVKTTAVTSRGLETFYQMKITTHYEIYPWAEISSVIREDRKHPELVALYFTRDIKTKRLFFLKKDAEKIMELARQQSPHIEVDDARENDSVKKSKKK